LVSSFGGKETARREGLKLHNPRSSDTWRIKSTDPAYPGERGITKPSRQGRRTSSKGFKFHGIPTFGGRRMACATARSVPTSTCHHLRGSGRGSQKSKADKPSSSGTQRLRWPCVRVRERGETEKHFPRPGPNRIGKKKSGSSANPTCRKTRTLIVGPESFTGARKGES